jgi:hypothetical protein
MRSNIGKTIAILNSYIWACRRSTMINKIFTGVSKRGRGKGRETSYMKNTFCDNNKNNSHNEK